jgi:hypothetical protein
VRPIADKPGIGPYSHHLVLMARNNEHPMSANIHIHHRCHRKHWTSSPIQRLSVSEKATIHLFFQNLTKVSSLRIDVVTGTGKYMNIECTN